ncbi:MAG: HD domain-containing protein [Epulopiscium sp.]|nr:HD domain-containing protein [Candidatus Epulonipiscium sp.]
MRTYDDIKNTKLYLEMIDRNSNFINQIDKVFKYATDTLPKINRIFSTYTGHGIEHSLSVMDYMFDLIEDIKLISDLEITALIYVALLHDIGMIVNEDEISKIKEDDLSVCERKYSLVLEKYGDEQLSLQECIRPIHGKRAKCHILSFMPDDWFNIPGSTNISFKNEVCDICISHNENFEWIKSNLTQKEVKGAFDLNTQYIAILLRISDLLDIDENRAPTYLYKSISPKGYSDLEWKQHFIIENKDKISYNKQTGYKYIEFYGTSTNPKTHRKLLKYFDYINEELKNSIKLSETFLDRKYTLLLKTDVENKIQTKGFNFSDFKLTLDYNAVTNLLMGENIYGDKKYGLRELIQNSVDACKVMLELSQSKPEFIYNPYQPFINIILDKDKKQVCVMDNGTGMSLDILKKYFLNVGVSYYLSDDYKLKGNKYNPIGNYGIGFLACFMLSDVVTVNTKYYGEPKLNKIEMEKNSEYICLSYEENARINGTEIILDYDQFMEAFSFNPTNIKKFIEDNFIDCGIKIKVIKVENGNNQSEDCTLNSINNSTDDIVRLENYLTDIEGYLEMSYKNVNFIEKLGDFEWESAYIYDIEEEVLLDEEKKENINIKDYINDNCVKYLRLPIITGNDADDFNKAFEVLEDFDDALNKIKSVDMIDIFCKDIGEFNYKEIIGDGDCIVGNFSYEDFCRKFDHDKYTKTYTYLREQKVVQTHSKKILPFDSNVKISDNYYWETKDKVFIKNVYIPQFKVTIPYLISGIQIKKGLFNILNKNIVPNVSRNNVSEITNKEFSYAIGKALHLWLIDNASLTDEEKGLIRKFIDTYYSEDNYCLR